MSSIRLSQKHGVNPSLEQCFFCGKDKGLILFGRLPEDKEAPRKVCMNHEPCDECAGHMKKGIILVSVADSAADDDPNPYRTGCMAVVTENAIRRMVNPPELVEEICRTRFLFIHDAAWKYLRLPTPEATAEA